MSEQDKLNIIQQMYTDFGDGNIPAVLNSMADDAVWKQPPGGTMPFAGTVRGREQLGEWFGQMDEVSNVEAFDVHDFFAKGNKVVVLGHMNIAQNSPETNGSPTGQWCGHYKAAR